MVHVVTVPRALIQVTAVTRAHAHLDTVALTVNCCRCLIAVIIRTPAYTEASARYVECSSFYLKLKLKLNKALDENSSLSYGASPAIWDHTVLPATRHK